MNNTDAVVNNKENDFFENIYGVLFYPKETFEDLKNSTPILESLLIVLTISILNPLIQSSLPVTKGMGWFVFSLFQAGLGGVIKWLFFAVFIELIATIFKKGGNFKIFLVLSAFALLPWIFIGPVSLLKTGGILSGLIGILFGIAIWLWTTILTILAIMKTYELSSGRVLILVAVPFIGGIIFFNWLLGFFSTLIQILSI